MQDIKFEGQLSEVEKAAWILFKNVSTSFLGNHLHPPPLGTTALGEPWPHQQPVFTALCLSSSPSTALSSLLSDLL